MGIRGVRIGGARLETNAGHRAVEDFERFHRRTTIGGFVNRSIRSLLQCRGITLWFRIHSGTLRHEVRPSNVATKPSPVVLTQSPRWWRSAARISASWWSVSLDHWLEPILASCSVEATISVKRTVLVFRSPSDPLLTPVKNSSISSARASVSPTKTRWSSPGRTTIRAPGM